VAGPPGHGRPPGMRTADPAFRTTGRPRSPAGPLVARSHPPTRPRPRTTGPAPGRVRRFVRRYGWRAYAIPLLTVATVLTLADLALSAPPAATATGVATEASAAPPSAAAPGGPTSSLDSDAGPTGTPSLVDAASFVQKGAGTVSVVDGTSRVYGTGPLQRFVVEIEDGIGVDGPGFAHAVQATLADPRSWGHGGRMSFQRVGRAQAAAEQYDFKVTLVSPGSLETYCPAVGTGGYTSCRYADRAVINLARWMTAVPDYQGDIATYRLYVVNHEVGHALGHGHEQCPGPGRLAPVMQQQTLGLDGCLKNPWPYP
jgi:Protein of unknown function (DUF3152)